MALKIITRFTIVLLFIVSTITSSISPIFPQQAAYALNGECDYNFFEISEPPIRLYDPCYVDCSLEDTDQVTVDDIQNSIWGWLLGKDLSPEQAAGVMGNIEADSGYNPFQFQAGATAEGMWEYDGDQEGYNGHAWGFLQWDGPRRISEDGKGGILGKLKTTLPEYADEYVSLTYGASARSYQNAPAKVTNDVLIYELEYMYAEATPGGNRPDVWKNLKSTSTVQESTNLFYEEFKGTSDEAGTSDTRRISLAQKAFDKFSQSGEKCGPSDQIIYYSQHTGPWANKIYGNDTYSNDGCGPTSMAIILASLLGDITITPDVVGGVAGHQVGGTSSHWNLISGVLAKWGGRGVKISGQTSLDEAIEFVKSGKGYVWMGGRGPREFTPFTSGGHLVAMVGVKPNGDITIADPHNPPHEQISDYTDNIIRTYSSSRYKVSVE